MDYLLGRALGPAGTALDDHEVDRWTVRDLRCAEGPCVGVVGICNSVRRGLVDVYPRVASSERRLSIGIVRTAGRVLRDCADVSTLLAAVVALANCGVGSVTAAIGVVVGSVLFEFIVLANDDRSIGLCIG